MSGDRSWIAAAVLIAAGSAVLFGTLHDTGGGQRLDASLPSDLGEASPGRAEPAPAALRDRKVPRPARVSIPAIDVRTPVISLGLRPDGTVEVPSMTEADRVGWYRGSARPGASGPTVLLGHLDSPSGPAVFYRLAELGPGDRVTVGRRDGSAVTFVVTHVGQYPKDHFPTTAVYGRTSTPQLRLITCGGAYGGDGYTDNVVVFARAADATSTASRR